MPEEKRVSIVSTRRSSTLHETRWATRIPLLACTPTTQRRATTIHKNRTSLLSLHSPFPRRPRDQKGQPKQSKGKKRRQAHTTELRLASLRHHHRCFAFQERSERMKHQPSTPTTCTLTLAPVASKRPYPSLSLSFSTPSNQTRPGNTRIRNSTACMLSL